MNGGEALTNRKKTLSGFEERRRLLALHFPELNSTKIPPLPTGVRCDDLLDAYAMLWTARRVKQRQHVQFPARGSEMDSRGLRAEILA
jgi:hypothetical protein